MQALESRLWDAADTLRANSKLRASDYSVPVLGLIFLRFADVRFSQAQKKLESANTSSRRGVGKADYQAKGVMYLPEKGRFSYLLALPEGGDLGQAVNDAMRAVEEENSDLKGVLPKTYNRFENSVLVELFKAMSSIPDDIEGDYFGKIYEYFLSNFAMGEGQRGGEFFTPPSIVKLIVNIIEPYSGRIYDPACGSGGMFVQSAEFVARHRSNDEARLSVYGQDRVSETIKLAKMNLAVHGLSGDIRQANTYYENPHNSVGKFGFVMANPPFNVNNVDKERLEGDARFPFGLPTVDNANYLWIQLFYSSLSDTGRAGFVMANSASDARHSEQAVRQQLVETGHVDVMVAVGSNFFYTVTLPCTLWFFDKGKAERLKDKVLFIDARNIYKQVTRAVREFTPAQLTFLSDIVRLYREDGVESRSDSDELLNEHFPDGVYRDVPGLCKAATLDEIAAQGWSLNPGRYVGVAAREQEDYDFAERLQELNEELELLNAEAHELEMEISENVNQLLISKA